MPLATLLRPRVLLLAVAAAAVFVAGMPAAAHAKGSLVVRSGAASTPVMGRVEAAGPVRGARVTLIRMDGRTITRVAATTDRRGTFYIAAGKLPTSFRVRVDGGRDRAGRILGKMYSIQHRRADHEPILVNPATTIVAVYRLVHPKMSIPVAERRVSRYLGLAKGVTLDVDLALTSRQFSGAVYMQRAKRHPARYARSLVTGIDSGKVRTFRAATKRSTSKAGVIGAPGATGRSNTGRNFSPDPRDVVQASSKLLNAVATMSEAGSTIIPGGAAIAPIFATVLPLILGLDMTDPTTAELQQVNQRLTAIEAQLDQIAGQLHDTQALIRGGAYDNSVAEFSELQGSTESAWQLYTMALQARIDHGPTSPEFVHAHDAFLGFYRVEGTTGVMVRGMDTLATKLNTPGGAAGANPLQNWNAAYLASDRFITYEDQLRMASAYEYWRDLHARLLVMNVEYALTSKAENSSVAGAATLPASTWASFFARTPGGDEAPRLAKWRSNAGLDQMTPMVHVWENWSEVYDTATGLMWANYRRNDVNVRWAEAKAQAEAADLYASGRPQGYTMSTRAELEGLFAAQGTVPGRPPGMTETDYLFQAGFGPWIKTTPLLWALPTTWDDIAMASDGFGPEIGDWGRTLSPQEARWRGYSREGDWPAAGLVRPRGYWIGKRTLRADEHPIPG